jgi:hypothetical protein
MGAGAAAGRPGASVADKKGRLQKCKKSKLSWLTDNMLSADNLLLVDSDLKHIHDQLFFFDVEWHINLPGSNILY